MLQPATPTRATVHIGTQVAAVLVVLLAIFALPCCPRIDGWFGAAQVRAAESAAVATTPDHQHHAGHQRHGDAETADQESKGLHKGHLMITAAVDVLPDLSPIVLAALIPLARIGKSRVARLALPRAPRIPVPPPRPAF